MTAENFPLNLTFILISFEAFVQAGIHSRVNASGTLLSNLYVRQQKELSFP